MIAMIGECKGGGYCRCVDGRQISWVGWERCDERACKGRVLTRIRVMIEGITQARIENISRRGYNNQVQKTRDGDRGRCAQHCLTVGNAPCKLISAEN